MKLLFKGQSYKNASPRGYFIYDKLPISDTQTKKTPIGIGGMTLFDPKEP
jgi:hypothetical protein